MPVNVRIPVPLQKLTGDKPTLMVEGSSVREIIQTLEAQYPGMAESILDDAGKIRRFVNIFVNEDNVRSMAGENTAVKDGDEISIIPAIAGG